MILKGDCRARTKTRKAREPIIVYLKEVDKCVLVCVRCHREIHAGVRIL